MSLISTQQKPKNPDKEKEAEKEEAPKKDTAVVLENDTGKKDVKEVAKDSKDVEEVAKAADANKAKVCDWNSTSLNRYN